VSARRTTGTGSTPPLSFLAIADAINAGIVDGTYPPGSFLPSVQALVLQFDASPHLVRRALRHLEARQVLGGVQGRPRVVLTPGTSSGRSLHEKVAATITGRIDSGDLPPGARLPAETTLAAEMNVARATVREALRRLEESGAIVRRNGRRYVVGTSAVPDMAYEVVAASVKRDISHHRRPGDRLPGESALAADYGVSRPTVRKALELLDWEGLVYSVPKVGWFVAEKTLRRPSQA
jgi:DNA-binding GntR family transcriptional regulator